MKAQFAIEYLFVVTALLFIILPTFTYVQITADKTSSDDLARNFVQTLASEIEFVASKGPGNTRNFTVIIPQGIDKQKSYIGNNTIFIIIGQKEYSRSLRTNVTGDVPESRISSMTLTSFKSGFVGVNDAKLLSADKIEITMPSDALKYVLFNVTNISDKPLTNIFLNINGPNIEEFVTIKELYSSDDCFMYSSIPVYGDITCWFWANSTYSGLGTFSGSVTVTSNDVIVKTIPFTITVV